MPHHRLFTEEEYEALLRELRGDSPARRPAPAGVSLNMDSSQSDSSGASQSGSSDTSPARQSDSSGASSPYEEWAAYNMSIVGEHSYISVGSANSSRSWYSYEAGGWFSDRVSHVTSEPVRRPQPEEQEWLRTIRWGYLMDSGGRRVGARIIGTSTLDPELRSAHFPRLNFNRFASLVNYLDQHRTLAGRNYVALHDQIALLMMPGPEVVEPERTIVLSRLNRLHVLGVLTTAETSWIWGRVLDRHLPSVHAFADANAPTEEEWWTLFYQVGERFSLRPPVPRDPASDRARRAAPHAQSGRAAPPTWPRAFSRLPRS